MASRSIPHATPAHQRFRPCSRPIKAERPHCEYLENPLGIDAARLRLSWILKADGRGETQTAYPLIPFYLYEYYGDDQPLRDHYDGLKRYVDYLTSRAVDDIVNIGLNDWAPYKTKTPADITDTAYYYRDKQVVELAASLLENRRTPRATGPSRRGSRRHSTRNSSTRSLAATATAARPR